jgi:hypothetical protein
LEVRELFSEKLLLALPADHGSFADSRNGGETRAAQCPALSIVLLASAHSKVVAAWPKQRPPGRAATEFLKIISARFEKSNR